MEDFLSSELGPTPDLTALAESAGWALTEALTVTRMIHICRDHRRHQGRGARELSAHTALAPLKLDGELNEGQFVKARGVYHSVTVRMPGSAWSGSSHAALEINYIKPMCEQLAMELDMLCLNALEVATTEAPKMHPQGLASRLCTTLASLKASIRSDQYGLQHGWFGVIEGLYLICEQAQARIAACELPGFDRIISSLTKNSMNFGKANGLVAHRDAVVMLTGHMQDEKGHLSMGNKEMCEFVLQTCPIPVQVHVEHDPNSGDITLTVGVVVGVAPGNGFAQSLG